MYFKARKDMNLLEQLNFELKWRIRWFKEWPKFVRTVYFDRKNKRMVNLRTNEVLILIMEYYRCGIFFPKTRSKLMAKAFKMVLKGAGFTAIVFCNKKVKL